MIDLSSRPKEILYYGQAKPLPEQVLLKAGPLSMIYENGAIRYIKDQNTEVLRMVYSAVRDHNWDTIEPEIIEEIINANSNNFLIHLEVKYIKNDINFQAKYLFSGSETGKLKFEMYGKCLSTFKKNRIGFCILHPIEECAGSPCAIVDIEGKTIQSVFPEQISPHQPFKNIKSMIWQLPNGTIASIKFEGEVFETEDQRNWTDASYKTYCTPLGNPFPVTVHEGQEIYQLVEVKVSSEKVVEEIAPLISKNTFNIDWNELNELPPIGICRSKEANNLSERDINLLKDIGFKHYRLDVKFSKDNWKKDLLEACEEAILLELPVEMALHFSQKNIANEIEQFISILSSSDVQVVKFLLFRQNSKTTPDTLETTLPVLRKHFKDAKIGAGTDAYFAELNRQTPSPKKFDFLTYSINPQVHAFDNLSLIETLKAQEYSLKSAKKLSTGKGVHISPVTLKPRFNPNATANISENEDLSHQVDVRQMSLFGAGWTLGSIKYLSEAKADSITYYETVGRKGLFMPEKLEMAEINFPSEKAAIFPVYHIFKEILSLNQSKVFKSKSSVPLQFDGLVIGNNHYLKILLANFTKNEIEVEIPFAEGELRIFEINAEFLLRRKFDKEKRIVKNGELIMLSPYGIKVIEVKI
jgi:D-apionolactonase